MKLLLSILLVLSLNVSGQGTQQEIQSRLNAGQLVSLTKDVKIGATLWIPNKVPNVSQKICIYLNGYAIIDTVGLPYMIARKAPDQKTALDTMQTAALILRDGMLLGRKGTGALLSVDATYGSIVEGVTFKYGAIGSDMHFALMSVHQSCISINQDSIGFNLDRGRWIDAVGHETQSNHSLRLLCRANNKDDAFAGFVTRASSGCEDHMIISEARIPKYHIVFDSEKLNQVKEYKASGLHFESTPDEKSVRKSLIAGIAYRGTGGIAIFDKIYAAHDQTLIDASSSNYPHLYVTNTPWLTANTKFKTTGMNCIWYFDETPNVNLTESTRWVGGLVPYYLTQRYLNQKNTTISKP